MHLLRPLERAVASALCSATLSVATLRPVSPLIRELRSSFFVHALPTVLAQFCVGRPSIFHALPGRETAANPPLRCRRRLLGLLPSRRFHPQVRPCLLVNTRALSSSVTKIRNSRSSPSSSSPVFSLPTSPPPLGRCTLQPISRQGV